MRSSRVSVWAVGLLLGASGCAGIRQGGPVAAPDGMAAVGPAPTGVRGWWSRRFGGGEGPAVRSDLGSIPPAGAFAGPGGGWGSVYQFSRPPWMARQPQRAPIFSMNRSGVPAQPKMTPAEINEAIARMTGGRRNDDQVLPVRNVDEPRRGPDDDDRDGASPLARPVALPDALADAPFGDDAGEGPAAPAAEPSPSIPPGGATLLGIRDAAEPAAAEEPADRLAMADPAPEAAARESQDAGLVRSSQVPPPPSIRPEPGAAAAPAADPVPPPPLDSPRPAEAPKPDDAVKPAEEPKPVEPPKPAEEPKPSEEPQLEEAPQLEQVPGPAVPTPPPVPSPSPPAPAPKPAEATPPGPAKPAPAPMETSTAAMPAPQPKAPAPQAPAPQPPASAPTTTTPTYSAPIATAAAAPRAHRWSFWNWRSGGGTAEASPQSPAALPPVAFPTSYESVWAKPLVPSPQATPQVAPSPQAGTAAEKPPCWLVERFKARARQFKAWKHEHVCRHIQDFKAALKGEGCLACKKGVTASPQAVPSPQARPTPQAKPSPQELPVIGGSRFGLY